MPARLALSAVGLLALACSPALEPQFTGTFTGNASIHVYGRPDTDVSKLPGVVTAAVVNDRLEISGVCPGGTGSMVADGTGKGAAGVGNVSCGAISVSGCTAVPLAIHNISALLSDDNASLHLAATLLGDGCGDMGRAQLFFDGKK